MYVILIYSKIKPASKKRSQLKRILVYHGVQKITFLPTTKPLPLVKADSEKASSKWKSATAINNECNTNVTESTKPKSFLTPSLPYFGTRRGSSPLVAELNALREADQRDKNVVVFPNRKVEDVPGIFIPSKQNSGISSNKTPQFLSVNEPHSNKRRRHSLSDPALLHQQISKSKPNWLSNLTSRSTSPFSQAVLFRYISSKCSLL